MVEDKVRNPVMIEIFVCLSYVISKYLNYQVIVYYVPRRTMRVIACRATMLAGDRSQGVIEAYSRDEAEARSVL